MPTIGKSPKLLPTFAILKKLPKSKQSPNERIAKIRPIWSHWLGTVHHLPAYEVTTNEQSNKTSKSSRFSTDDQCCRDRAEAGFLLKKPEYEIHHLITKFFTSVKNRMPKLETASFIFNDLGVKFHTRVRNFLPRSKPTYVHRYVPLFRTLKNLVVKSADRDAPPKMERGTVFLALAAWSSGNVSDCGVVGRVIESRGRTHM
jgi:hypothetical protein